MKNTRMLGAAIHSAACMAGSSIHAAAEVGKAAPDFKLPASNGFSYQRSKSLGKFVVLEWFNKDCPFTRKHYDSGNMQSLQEKYVRQGVVWYSICSSAPDTQGYMTPAQAAIYPMKYKVKATAVLEDSDGAVGRSYGAKTTPHLFIINPQGIVVYAGAIDDHNSADPADIPRSKNYVVEALDAVLAGRTVKIATTKPYGCSIKYQ